MGVICNGPRKAGTNALRKAVCSLGYTDRPGGIVEDHCRASKAERIAGIRRPITWMLENLRQDEAIGAHNPQLNPDPHKMIVILRNPQNMAVSFYRARYGDDKSGFSEWLKNGRGFFGWSEAFYRMDLQALYVSFETLFSKETYRLISAYLNKDQTDANLKRYMAAYGHSATWSGKLSDYQEWFSELDNQVFRERWSND